MKLNNRESLKHGDRLGTECITWGNKNDVRDLEVVGSPRNHGLSDFDGRCEIDSIPHHNGNRFRDPAFAYCSGRRDVDRGRIIREEGEGCWVGTFNRTDC